jgi:hypothetical protein
MNVITDTLRQIVRRKLWPVALVLIGALAAVPLVLAKQPAAEPVANAANAHKVEPQPATFVSAPDATAEQTTRRRVLGGIKDPFEPAPAPKVKKAKKKASTTAKQADDTTTPDNSGGTSAGGGTPTAPPVAPQPTATPTPTIPAFSIKVRFGSTEGKDALPTTTIERLSVLPDEENPLVVYRGVEDGGKVAVFELTGGIVAQGDGACAPTPEDCQYVRLHAGETEFFTVPATDDTGTGLQFQLDLVKIYKKATKEKATDATTATQSLAKAPTSALSSKAVTLRRRNRYVFDATTGTLHRAAKGQKTPLSSL